MNQENCEINLGVERVLTGYNKYLSRATDKDGISIIFFFEKEIVDGNDQINVYWIMLA